MWHIVNFYDATEEQFDRLNIDKADCKLESFKTNISDIAKSGNAKNQLFYEREKLYASVRSYEEWITDLWKQHRIFISFSKKGNHLLDDMNQKVEKIKSELS